MTDKALILDVRSGVDSSILISAVEKHFVCPAFILEAHALFDDADCLAFQSFVDSVVSYLASGVSARLVFVGIDATQTIPVCFIEVLTGFNIKDLDRIVMDASGVVDAILPHRPLQDVAAKTLAVFPGLMFPLSMGSHQRAFRLLTALCCAGLHSDILLSGSADGFKKFRPLLLQFCPRVYHYNGRTRTLPLRLRLRKGLERHIGRLQSKAEERPDLFEERLEAKASFSGMKALRRILDGGRYNSVIVNYAWMARIRERVPKAINDSLNWVCDSHDVQFVRNETANVSKKRLFVSTVRDRGLEVASLKAFDKVLAISVSDAEILSREIGRERVILVPTGFDYALMPPKEIGPGDPVFGFIGGAMAANVTALELILKDWWPEILGRWPNATLRVAGAIANVPSITRSLFLRDDVVVDGYIDSLKDWYRMIDCLLNPVVVQGGLNFKSVEALMAGRVLVTSSIGHRCLGADSLAVVADDGREAVEALCREFAFPPTEYIKRRIQKQAEAKKSFGDEVAYRDLLSALSFSDRKSLPLRPDSRRVLIQCGDHHENRERIATLAVEVRKLGYRPIVLVYSADYVDGFRALGVEAVALADFEESRVQRAQRRSRLARHRTLAKLYRGFDLDDISMVDQANNPRRFQAGGLRGRLDTLTNNVDRILRLIESVDPSVLCIWNGYTGVVANVLRQYSRHSAMPVLFMERSLFPEGVYVDPCGVNGFSRLAGLDRSKLAMEGSQEVRSMADFSPPLDKFAIAELRDSVMQGRYRRIIFVPLQVQSDTNIVLHSPEIRTMRELVGVVLERYGDGSSLIVVRPHPEETNRNLELPAHPDLYVTAEGDLGCWLEAADAVVTINSTVGLEAMLRDKPVLALGFGIYTGKALAGGGGISREQIALFWRCLVGGYTVIPGAPAAALVETLVADGARTNADTLARSELKKVAERVDEAIEIFVSAARILGVCQVVTDLRPDDRLNLTYRKLSVPVTREWLAGRLRARFQLAEEIEIRMGRISGFEIPSIFVSRSGAWNPRCTITVDRYGWPVPVSSDGSGAA